MSDDLTNIGENDRIRISGNEIWEVNYEIDKFKKLYPKHSRTMIKNAIEWALKQNANNRMRAAIEKDVHLYLTVNPAV